MGKSHLYKKIPPRGGIFYRTALNKRRKTAGKQETKINRPIFQRLTPMPIKVRLKTMLKLPIAAARLFKNARAKILFFAFFFVLVNAVFIVCIPFLYGTIIA